MHDLGVGAKLSERNAVELRPDGPPRVQLQKCAPRATEFGREWRSEQVGQLAVEIAVAAREVVREDFAARRPRDFIAQGEVVLGVAADDVEEGPKKWLRSRTRWSTHSR